MRGPALRPGFGPPLRLPRWGQALVALALLAVLAFVVLSGDDREHLVVDADPEFNVLYDDSQLREAELGPGEVLRLQGSRRRVEAEVVVRALELPDYRGDVSSGLLPVLAERHRDELAAELPGFELHDEGRARVGTSPGYQVGYRADGRVAGRDVFVVKGPKARRGYLVSLLLRGEHRRAAKVVREARRAFRSFAFGSGRP